MAAQEVDTRILSCGLQCRVIREDVVELVAIGAGDDDRAVALVQLMAVYVP